jgi:hypothetical protein
VREQGCAVRSLLYTHNSRELRAEMRCFRTWTMRADELYSHAASLCRGSLPCFTRRSHTFGQNLRSSALSVNSATPRDSLASNRSNWKSCLGSLEVFVISNKRILVSFQLAHASANEGRTPRAAQGPIDEVSVVRHIRIAQLTLSALLLLSVVTRPPHMAQFVQASDRSYTEREAQGCA